MSRTYDLVIVGAGFAGLAAAQAASIRGLKTMVLERKPEVGHRPHTTGLLVKEVADTWDVPRDLTRRIPGVRLYSPALRSIDLVRPGYHFLATDTPGVMRWWAQQARSAGSWVRCDSAYRGAVSDGDLLRLQGYEMCTRYLLGADGCRSKVAEDFQLGINRKYLVGVEVEYQNVKGVDDSRLHVFLDSQLAPGYIGWVIPGLGATQVGLASIEGSPIRLEAFLLKLRTLFDFSGAQELSRRGGRIPVGGPVYPMGKQGVMLIGDAAGLVSPLTAGGIHTAIHFGRLAGLAVTDHLLEQGPDPVAVMRKIVPRYHCKSKLRSLYNRAVPNKVYDVLFDSPLFRSMAQAVFFHNRGFFNWATWADAWHQLKARPE